MAYVITEKCLGEQYADCVEVCPVDCIYPGAYKAEPFMVIDPELCIDCDACLPACPIDAIVPTVENDPAWAKINAELAPNFKNNPAVPPRPAGDPPRKPGNKLVR
ncbi:MAG: 4Fe-4S binding protein [Deltaproteobacteria bacterium]|nr:4Fe-4S binding protein [Deltaproteobacteria bacterium]